MAGCVHANAEFRQFRLVSGWVVGAEKTIPDDELGREVLVAVPRQGRMMDLMIFGRSDQPSSDPTEIRLDIGVNQERLALEQNGDHKNSLQRRSQKG